MCIPALGLHYFLQLFPHFAVIEITYGRKLSDFWWNNQERRWLAQGYFVNVTLMILGQVIKGKNKMALKWLQTKSDLLRKFWETNREAEEQLLFTISFYGNVLYNYLISMSSMHFLWGFYFNGGCPVRPISPISSWNSLL